MPQILADHPHRALKASVAGHRLRVVFFERAHGRKVGADLAQRCHANHCPTGITTQNRWLTSGLDPTLKSVRVANYIVTLRKKLLALSRACGVEHPALVTVDHLEILDDRFGAATVSQLFGYQPGYGVPSPEDRQQIRALVRVGRTG